MTDITIEDMILPAIFSLASVMVIAYCVFRLCDVGSRRRFLRVFFSPTESQVIPWGIVAIVLSLLLFFLAEMVTQNVLNLILPNPISFLYDENKEADILPDTEVLDETVADTSFDANGESDSPLANENLAEQHTLVILMQKGGQYPIVIVVCLLAAVVVAPLTEELMFRVIMQCGIESTFRRESGNTPLARRISIFLTALFFAAIHFRTQQSQIDIDLLFNGMIGMIIARPLALLLVVGLLRFHYRVRWADLGFRNFRLIGRDALGALLLFLIIFVPIFTVHGTVFTLAKTDWAVQHGISAAMLDPIPLFLFALVIGSLYYRTRRLVPVFFLHAFFNLYSFLVLLYLVFG